MTDLTEKMKNRTLEDKRLYYCLFDNPKDYLAVYYGHYINDFHFDTYRRNNSVKIIGQVPTYEELQELKSKRDKLAYDLGVADTKNGELLRLLKECQEIIEWYKADCGYKDLPTESVLTKIRKVLK